MNSTISISVVSNLLAVILATSNLSITHANRIIPLDMGVTAVSDNGRYIVGTISNYPNLPYVYPAFGTAEGVSRTLKESARISIPNAVSNDGRRIVGERQVPSPVYTESFLWTADGPLPIEDVSTSQGQNIASDITSDGRVIVGGVMDSTLSYMEAYLWTDDTGALLLGDLPGGQHMSRATAVSADGAVIVGSSIATEGEQAFRWTHDSGLVGLGYLPGSNPHTEAYNISADGSTIIGFGITENYRREAFRWTSRQGMQPLGVLPGFDVSLAYAVSGDGRIVVGFVDDNDTQRAFVWDPLYGMRELQAVLEEEFGLADILEGWELMQAIDISADGRVIVGKGYNPDGNIQAWLVRLDRPIFVPEPSSIALAFLAAGVALLRRERRALT